MNILVIEASGNEVALAAIEIDDALFVGAIGNAPRDFQLDDARVRVVWSSDDVRSMSRELVVRIDQTLRDADWQMSDVQAVAVGLGPGSWTSLRVVLATAKTLAQTCDWKIVGVPSFDAIARAAWQQFQFQHKDLVDGNSDATSSTRSSTRCEENALIVVVSNSRAGEIYSKIFRVCDREIGVERREIVQSREQLYDEIGALTSVPLLVLWAGEAPAATLNCWQGGHNDNALAAFLISAEETALHIGLIAAVRLVQNQSDDALTLQPLYVAQSAAERNLAQHDPR